MKFDDDLSLLVVIRMNLINLCLWVMVPVVKKEEDEHNFSYAVMSGDASQFFIKHCSLGEKNFLLKNFFYLLLNVNLLSIFRPKLDIFTFNKSVYLLIIYDAPSQLFNPFS